MAGAGHPETTPFVPQLDMTDPPFASDRRAFMMRSALAVAIAALTGRPIAAIAQVPATAPQPVKLDPALDVVKKSKGPVVTTVDEFYKVGPGPRRPTRSGRCGSPTTSISAVRNCRTRSATRRPH